MELKNFIKGTLEEIVGALADFEASSNNHGATAFTEIWTDGSGAASVGMLKAKKRQGQENAATVLTIHFDVAVTVETEGIKMAEGGLKFPGLGGAGASGTETDKNVSINRLTFSVPVELPVTESRATPSPDPVKIDFKGWNE
ncbi:hypothetical protein [Kordiimonas sp.]|uniref:hypothetical protein n=1 Tax=Kordiimonas sp. TaxID=1970157 RepID=UPI003A8C9285